MKNLKVVFMAILLIAFTYSCQKFEKQAPESPDASETSMKDLSIPDGFDWSMTADYDFYISGGSGGTVLITSQDENIVYHKGTYIEDNGSYNVKLRLPSTVHTVKINSIPVDLNGEFINYNLSTKSEEVNHSLYFDGDDEVNMGDITELNNVAAFTIEGWANQANTAISETIFGKQPGNTDHRISMYSYNNELVINVCNGGISEATWTNYSSTISSGSWYHWAIVYDGGGLTNDDRLKLYIDGNTTPVPLNFTWNDTPTTTSSFMVGQSAFLSPSSTSCFTGYMDEIRIWSTARTANEIHDNFNQLLAGDEAGLVAYYQCDEGSGTTLGDLAGNYDGVISGATFSTEVSYAADSDGDGVDDNYDDYNGDADRAYNNYYPAEDTGTVVFEDLWPSTGDYDFNDLVMGYQFKTVTNSLNKVVEINAYFELRANGAGYNNAFGFQLPNANPAILSNVVVTGYHHTQSLVSIHPDYHFEMGQTNPVVIVLDAVYSLMNTYENTDEWKSPVPYIPITITLTPSTTDFVAADFDIQNWDPFIIIGQDRTYEVHKIDHAPTDLANPLIFGTLEDDSNIGDNEYYRTATGLPWALDFASTFEYPFEKANILQAYLHFKEWAEGDSNYDDWFTNGASGYRDTDYIYH